MKKWRRENEILFSSPQETMGFSKDQGLLKISSVIQNFLIKKFDFSSLEQVKDIKKQLLGKKILIINAKEIIENGRLSLEELKKGLDEIKEFLRENGGSIGRIGDQYLIITPNSHVKIAN